MKNMDFDEILQEIGEFGRFQKINYLLICLPVMFAAANSLLYVFTAGTPSYRCLIPECDGLNKTQLYPSWIANAVPANKNKNGVFKPEPCYRYKSSVIKFDGLHFSAVPKEDICKKRIFNRETTERCYKWVFDSNERTIVQEWGLTCKENAWRLALVGTMHFAGLVVGTALSGYLADLFGRKSVFITCTVFMSIAGIAQGLSWNYSSFIIFTFLNAIGTSGVYPLAFILALEMVGPCKRDVSAIVLNYFHAVGETLVGATAWLLHDWQLLQFALSAPALFCIVYYWLLTESVRWLIAKNQREKVRIIIQRAAQVNRKKLSIKWLKYFNGTQRSTEQNICVTQGKILDGNRVAIVSVPSSSQESKNEILCAVKEVFKSKRLLLRYTIMLYIWAVTTFVFYGLSLNSTNLSGNKYLNFSLVCLVEIPAYTLAWFSLRKFGRRLSLAGSFFLCATTCVVGGYMTEVATNLEERTTWTIIALFLLGKLGATSASAVVYTYTAEMMPTVIRSAGVGVMSTFARFGAMLAPLVPLLGAYHEALPLLLFGAAALSAGVCALTLPETFCKKLPDIVQEAKNLGTKDAQNSAQQDTSAEVQNDN